MQFLGEVVFSKQTSTSPGATRIKCSTASHRQTQQRTLKRRSHVTLRYRPSRWDHHKTWHLHLDIRLELRSLPRDCSYCRPRSRITDGVSSPSRLYRCHCRSPHWHLAYDPGDRYQRHRRHLPVRYSHCESLDWCPRPYIHLAPHHIRPVQTTKQDSGSLNRDNHLCIPLMSGCDFRESMLTHSRSYCWRQLKS